MSKTITFEIHIISSENRDTLGHKGNSKLRPFEYKALSSNGEGGGNEILSLQNGGQKTFSHAEEGGGRQQNL